MQVHGWCQLHEKMVDKTKAKNKCHPPKQKRCRHFSFQVPKHLKGHKRRVEGYGEFRSRD